MPECQARNKTAEVIIPWTCKCGTKLVADVKYFRGFSCGYQAVCCPTCGLETELPSRPLRLSYYVGNCWRTLPAIQ